MNYRDVIHKAVEKLQNKITILEQVLEKKDLYIKTLEDTLKNFKKHRFGPRSEKINKDQLNLFNEAELIGDSPESPKKPKKKKKTGKRGTLPKNLKRIEKIHDIDESQKKCPHDQSELKHIGEVITEQLFFKLAVIKVIQHKQFKYACKCCGKYIITAKKPKEIIPKSIAIAELLAYITASKYADSLPLHRLSHMFKRLDVKISRQNCANWMIKCSNELKLFIDEVLHTTVPSGAMGRALKYIQNQWHKLIRYIDDGSYPIDNNAAKNAIRPFVVGRKNWSSTLLPILQMNCNINKHYCINTSGFWGSAQICILVHTIN